SDQLIDPLRSVLWGAVADCEEAQPPVGLRRQLLLDRLTSDLGDRRAAPTRLQTQAYIDLLGQHDRRALHAYILTHHSHPSAAYIPRSRPYRPTPASASHPGARRDRHGRGRYFGLRHEVGDLWGGPAVPVEDAADRGEHDKMGEQDD